MIPEDFASGIEKCLEAGAKLVGGCCGTTPAHIKMVTDRLR
jgi:5-methyltetrahydrofolate--homocysteine methyltransferase